MARSNQFFKLLAAAVLGVLVALALKLLFEHDEPESPVDAAAVSQSSILPTRGTAFSPSRPGIAVAGADKSLITQPDEGGEFVRAGGGIRARDSDDGDGKPSDAPLVTQNNPSGHAVAARSVDDPERVETPADWCFRAAVGSNSKFGPVFETRERHFFASDSGDVWNGSRAVTLGTNGFGVNTDVMWQAVDAAPYRGSRIKVSARLRSTGYAAYLFIGFRDAMSNGVALADKQQHLLIQNNQLPVAWTPFEVDLDVPSDATLIYYGAAIYNGGQLWMDDLHVEGVESVGLPAPAQPSAFRVIVPIDPSQFLAAPSNLDFEITNDSDKKDAHGC